MKHIARVPKLLKNRSLDINLFPNYLESAKMILYEIKRQIILNVFPFSKANPPSVAASSSVDQARRRD